MSFQELQALLKKIDLEKLSLQAIEATESEAVSLNVDDQLFDKGIKSDGSPVGEYSMLTKKIKAAKGQRYDHMTLRDTTNFHDSFFLKSDKYPVMFDARDWKKSMLVERYSKEIFGLTSENLTKYSTSVLPAFQKEVRDALGI